MNRWKFLLSGAAFGFLCFLTLVSCSGVRQRSDGCGPHPLIALAAASRPFASTAASLNELLRVVRSDSEIWSEMQILLRRYDDCIRAGDGLHYKRSSSSVPEENDRLLTYKPILNSLSHQEFSPALW